MLLSSSQMYSKLFRPWDAIEEESKLERNFILEEKLQVENFVENSAVDNKTEQIKIEKRHRISTTDKGNKLRKVRNICKPGINQDCTISTTTTDETSLTNNHTKENPEKCNGKYNEQDEINKRLGYSTENYDGESDVNWSYTKKDSVKNIPRSIKDVNDTLPTHKSKELSKIKLDKKTLNDKDISCTQLPYLNIPSYKDPTSSANISPISNLVKNSERLNQNHADNIMMNHPEYFPYPMDGFSNPHGRYPADLLSQAELAQSLGIPPTDPLLMESFAHGYAMELEYARIMHQETQAKLLNARKQRPKKYRCPHCDVGFSNNGQLKGHVRIHTGERPFKCDDKTCGKTFTRNEELTRHRRIHSGLRPYPCQTCGKKFGRRDHLKKHTRTHMVQAERMMPMFVPLAGLPTVGGYPYLYGY